MTKTGVVCTRLGILLGLFILWQLIVLTGFADVRTLPLPSTVLVRVVEMLGDRDVLFNLWITVAQVFLAFAIVVPIGIVAGLFLGESKYWGQVFKPFFYFMASVPKSVFLPLFILAIGTGFSQKVVFGIFQAIFVLVICAIAATETVPNEYLKMARSYGATRRQLYVEIYLPAMLPILLEGLRLGMIFNITGVLFAEMYASRAGLGHLVALWGMRFEMVNLFAGIALASILAILINETLRHYENKLSRWRT